MSTKSNRGAAESLSPPLTQIFGIFFSFSGSSLDATKSEVELGYCVWTETLSLRPNLVKRGFFIAIFPEGVEIMMENEDADKLESIQNICNKIVECTNLYSFAEMDDQEVYSLMKLREIAHRVITDQDTKVTENELTSAMCYYTNRMADSSKEIVKVLDRILSASLDDQQLHLLLRVKELLCGIIRGAKDVEIEPSNHCYLVAENDLSITESINAIYPTKEDVQLRVAQSMMDLIVEDESFQIESELGNKEGDELHIIHWPANGSITLEWVLDMMSTLEKSSWKNLPSEFRRVVSVDVVDELLNKAGSILHQEPNCVQIDLQEEGSRVVVIGDIQGQYHDLLNLLVLANFASRNQFYIYCGNYVGRGAWGLEVFLILSAWKVLMPDRVFLLRGNHESRHCASACGFEEEVRIKYGEQGGKVYDICLEIFKELPLATIIAGKVYVTHGGIFRKGSAMSQQKHEGTFEKIVQETSEQMFEVSEKISEPVSNHLSEQMFEQLSEQTLRKTSKQMAEKRSETFSEKASDQFSEKLSEQQTPDKVSDLLSEQMLQNVSEKTSEPLFEQISESTSDQLSQQWLDQTSEKMAEQRSEQTSKQLSKQMNKETSRPNSNQLPEDRSEQMTSQISEQIPTGMSESISEQLSDQRFGQMNYGLSESLLDKTEHSSEQIIYQLLEPLHEQTSKKVFEQLSDPVLNQQSTQELEVGSLEELFKTDRYLMDPPSEDEDPNIMVTDVLWSDPSKGEGLKTNRGRALGLQWGPDCTEAFLKRNNLKAIIRSHEGPYERDGQNDFGDMLSGYSIDHDGESGKLYTLFSAPDYPKFGKKSFHNEGAYAVLESPNIEIPTFHTFKAVDRPKALTDANTPVDRSYPAGTSSAVNFAALGIVNPPQWTVVLSDDEAGSRFVEIPKARVVEGLTLPSNLENPHKAAYEYFLELIAGLKLMVQKRGSKIKVDSPLQKKRKFS